jgi:hypothetical protein
LVVGSNPTRLTRRSGPLPSRNRHDPGVLPNPVAVSTYRWQTVGAVLPSREVLPDMIHPSDPDRVAVRVVRDGQMAPVTCGACGCRLDHSAPGTWYHFGRFAGRDARGCRVECVDLGHDAAGQPMASVAV